MKLTYTISKSDEQGERFLPEEGPFEKDLGELTFTELNSWFGVMPPFEVLKEIYRSGSEVNDQNICYRWEPFDLSEEIYESLLTQVKNNPEWGIEIEFPPPEEKVWSHWALVRSMDKHNRKK